MKKALQIIKNIFVWIVVALAVFMMVFTIVSVNTLNRSDRTLFGYRVYTVLSDSMSKTDFSAGDVVLVKATDPSTLQAGDIIAYQSQDEANYGETVTHKIRTVTTDANGNPGFITYGTTTDTDDQTVVTYQYVLGKYQMHIPNVGRFFTFLKTTPGYVVCILIPFMVLILIQGINSIQLFRRYKKEQLADMESERVKIENERAESVKMMAQLQELQSQLAATKNSSSPAAPAPEPNTPEPNTPEPKTPEPKTPEPKTSEPENVEKKDDVQQDHDIQ